VIVLNKKIWIIVIVIIIITVGFGIFLFLNIPNLISYSYSYDLKTVFPNLSFSSPVGLYDPNDGTNRLFVVQQNGLIKVFENNANVTDASTFLDIGSEITYGGERGLLGLAFHPNYTSNGYFYVDYTDTSGDTIISRFKVDGTNPNTANQTSEVEILKVNQPYSNHNGGQIAFGPDGYLYIGLGDGGSGGDPEGNGQNRQTLLGSILRIDVDSGLPYAIPTDNPFFGNINGYAEEIFAFGFRNPWRFSFDAITGDLWVGDVGQALWEEIDIVEYGKNYGWNAREGAHDYDPGTNTTSVIDPIYEYSHSLGNAITGGFVYRGSSLSNLVGKYVYADYGSGRIWALEFQDGTAVNNTLLYDASFSIPSFGVDSNNELYICAFDGKIYQLSEKIS
jgi:glucose/arabinose dehydrogenase